MKPFDLRHNSAALFATTQVRMQHCDTTSMISFGFVIISSLLLLTWIISHGCCDDVNVKPGGVLKVEASPLFGGRTVEKLTKHSRRISTTGGHRLAMHPTKIFWIRGCLSTPFPCRGPLETLGITEQYNKNPGCLGYIGLTNYVGIIRIPTKQPVGKFFEKIGGEISF